MESSLQWLLLVISTTICFAAQGFFVLVVLNKNIKWKRLLLFALTNSLAWEIQGLVMSHYAQVWYMVSYIIVVVLTIKFILKLKFVESILATSIILLASAIVQYASQVTFDLLGKGNTIALTETFISAAFLRNISNMFWVAGGLLIYFFRAKIHMPEDLSRRKSFLIGINFIVTAILVIPNCLFFEASKTTPVTMFVFNIVSVFTLLLISIYNSIKSGELELKKQEVEFQKLYIKTLNDTIDGMRGIKHDYNNVIQALGGYLTLNDLEGLKKYFRQMKGESHMINNTLPLNNYVKDNPALYGLLLSKVAYCEVKDVELYICVLHQIELSGIKIYDFTKVFGILMDNAIEAASQSKKRYVELCVKENSLKTALEIEISNTFFDNIDLQKIFESGYTTKDGHSGFGLWEVKKILAKYSNCKLETVYRDNLFIQKITMLY